MTARLRAIILHRRVEKSCRLCFVPFCESSFLPCSLVFVGLLVPTGLPGCTGSLCQASEESQALKKIEIMVKKKLSMQAHTNLCFTVSYVIY